jgi:dynein heavy chain
MYPGLVSCTTIDWFSDWPQDALLEVGEYILQGVSLLNEAQLKSDEDKDKDKDKKKKKKTEKTTAEEEKRPVDLNTLKLNTLNKVCSLFVGCHQAAVETSDRMMYALGRRVHITPTSFRELCQSYRAVLVEKRAIIEAAAAKLRSGLGVLKSTREDVEVCGVLEDNNFFFLLRFVSRRFELHWINVKKK